MPSPKKKAPPGKKRAKTPAPTRKEPEPPPEAPEDSSDEDENTVDEIRLTLAARHREADVKGGTPSEGDGYRYWQDDKGNLVDGPTLKLAPDGTQFENPGQKHVRQKGINMLKDGHFCVSKGGEPSEYCHATFMSTGKRLRAASYPKDPDGVRPPNERAHFNKKERQNQVSLLQAVWKRQNDAYLAKLKIRKQEKYEESKTKIERAAQEKQESKLRKRQAYASWEAGEKERKKLGSGSTAEKSSSSSSSLSCSSSSSAASGVASPNPNTMVTLWRRRITFDEKDFTAHYELGMLLMNGEGVIKDEIQAAKHFRHSAFQGFAFAQCWLAAALKDDNQVVQNELDSQGLSLSAFDWYQKAAKQEHCQAQKHLALMYAYGDGVGQCKKKAFQYCEAAAKQGDGEAQCYLGQAFLEATGCKRNEASAYEWYLKAAEQDVPSAEAQYQIGDMLANGCGVAENHVEAAAWWDKAMQRGHLEAKFSFANALTAGRGVLKDEAKASKLRQEAELQQKLETELRARQAMKDSGEKLSEG